MQIYPYLYLQKWQDQLHFDRNVKALQFIYSWTTLEYAITHVIDLYLVKNCAYGMDLYIW